MIARVAVANDVTRDQRVRENAGTVNAGGREIAIDPAVLDAEAIFDRAYLDALDCARRDGHDLAPADHAAVGAIGPTVHVDIAVRLIGIHLVATKLAVLDDGAVGVDVQQDIDTIVARLEDEIADTHVDGADHDRCRIERAAHGNDRPVLTVAQANHGDAGHIQADGRGRVDRLRVAGQHINNVALVGGAQAHRIIDGGDRCVRVLAVAGGIGAAGMDEVNRAGVAIDAGNGKRATYLLANEKLSAGHLL